MVPLDAARQLSAVSEARTLQTRSVGERRQHHQRVHMLRRPLQCLFGDSVEAIPFPITTELILAFRALSAIKDTTHMMLGHCGLDDEIESQWIKGETMSRPYAIR